MTLKTVHEIVPAVPEDKVLEDRSPSAPEPSSGVAEEDPVDEKHRIDNNSPASNPGAHTGGAAGRQHDHGGDSIQPFFSRKYRFGIPMVPRWPQWWLQR